MFFGHLKEKDVFKQNNFISIPCVAAYVFFFKNFLWLKENTENIHE